MLPQTLMIERLRQEARAAAERVVTAAHRLIRPAATNTLMSAGEDTTNAGSPIPMSPPNSFAL